MDTGGEQCDSCTGNTGGIAMITSIPFLETVIPTIIPLLSMFKSRDDQGLWVSSHAALLDTVPAKARKPTAFIRSWYTCRGCVSPSAYLVGIFVSTQVN